MQLLFKGSICLKLRDIHFHLITLLNEFIELKHVLEENEKRRHPLYKSYRGFQILVQLNERSFRVLEKFHQHDTHESQED